MNHGVEWPTPVLGKRQLHYHVHLFSYCMNISTEKIPAVIYYPTMSSRWAFYFGVSFVFETNNHGLHLSFFIRVLTSNFECDFSFQIIHCDTCILCLAVLWIFTFSCTYISINNTCIKVLIWRVCFMNGVSMWRSIRRLNVTVNMTIQCYSQCDVSMLRSRWQYGCLKNSEI